MAFGLFCRRGLEWSRGRSQLLHGSPAEHRREVADHRDIWNSDRPRPAPVRSAGRGSGSAGDLNFALDAGLRAVASPSFRAERDVNATRRRRRAARARSPFRDAPVPPRSRGAKPRIAARHVLHSDRLAAPAHAPERDRRFPRRSTTRRPAFRPSAGPGPLWHRIRGIELPEIDIDARSTIRNSGR